MPPRLPHTLRFRLAAARCTSVRAAHPPRSRPHLTLPALATAALAVLAATLQPSTGGSDPVAAPSSTVTATSRPGYLVQRSMALTPATPAPAERRASDRGGARSAPPAPTETPPATTPTPSEAPAPTAEPTPTRLRPISLEVAEGDTIAHLAECFGVSEETILWANDLAPGQALEPGQRLTILPVSGVLHTVRPGDTLNAIARARGADPEAIVAANALAAPDRLSVGQELIVPGGRPLPTPTPPPAPTATPQAESAAAVEPAAEAPPPEPAAGSKGEEIVAIATRYLGYPYVYGGSSPATGFDCSGFTQYVYAQAGISIPRHSAAQPAAGPAVSRDALLPGDLVFFAGTYGAGISHVGIYVGNGRMIHSSTPGVGVCYDSLDAAYWVAHYYGACRPWQ
jgi:cell wall-associated NlpC family hydrolase